MTRAAKTNSSHAAHLKKASDRDLVTACLRGDDDAWTEVWLRYGPMVKAVARRKGCDDDECKDVVQRVALIALQNLETLKDHAKLPGWLAGATRYQAFEIIRQRRRTGPLPETVPSVEPGLDETLVRDEQLATLRHAFVRLDLRCRRLIELLHLREPPASYREVGSVLDLAETSIGPIRRRCLQRLKKLIEKLSR